MMAWFTDTYVSLGLDELTQAVDEEIIHNAGIFQLMHCCIFIWQHGVSYHDVVIPGSSKGKMGDNEFHPSLRLFVSAWQP